MLLLKESSPHMHNGESTSLIMFMVIVGLIPASIVHVLCFGWGLAWHFLICSATASFLEGVILLLRKKSPIKGLMDFSLQVTVLIFCLAIPPYLNITLSILGISFATIIVKHAFGGLGQNTFNPAMAGYIFLLVSVPGAMGFWVTPNTQNLEIYSPNKALHMVLMHQSDDKSQLIIDNNALVLKNMGYDGATYATPLNRFRIAINNDVGTQSYIKNWVDYNINTNGMLILNFAYIIGGIFLIITGFINTIQPLAFLLSIYIVGIILNLLGNKYGFITINPVEHLFLGGTMIGAFFIITDPVSSPTTTMGKIISASLIGTAVVVIRTFGNYPDAVAFSALLGNSFNPLINKLCKPIRFGKKTDKKIKFVQQHLCFERN